jgi:hypothetical protein
VIGSTDWQEVEAIGTVGAVIVALTLALWPAFRTRQRRPKLALKVSGVEPHCVAIAGARSVAEEVVLRVEVRNDGKTSARTVTAKVTDMWIKDLPTTQVELDLGIAPNTSDNWRLRQSEPTALRWASVPSPQVTIAPKSSEFVQLVSLRTQDLELTLCMEYPERSVIKPKFEEGFGRHRLRVSVFAENSEPTTHVVEFVIDGKNFIGQVGFTSEPDEAQDTRLLTLLRELHSGD